MSVRNLEKLFKPRSIALIGATPRAGSVGAVVARNLHRAGFIGELMLVNPYHHTIDGLPVHPNVVSLPQASDLAVIITPPETVPCLIGELGERGTRAAVIITAGFGELGERGQALQQAMLDAAKPYLLRIVGPNCVGIMVPQLGLDASFSHLAARPGDIAFLSQSGAIVTAMLDWAAPPASVSHMSSRWGIWRMSILATCSTISLRIRLPVPSYSTSKASPMAANSCPRRERRRAASPSWS
jgi:acetyltransferase